LSARCSVLPDSRRNYFGTPPFEASASVRFDPDVGLGYISTEMSTDGLDVWFSGTCPRSIWKEADDRFYAELIKYLHGEPSDIHTHTVGEAKALIAKKLTDEDPELLIPEMRVKLMAAVEEIYESDHAVTVTLTKDDLAFVQMLVTHEDDMGRA